MTGFRNARLIRFSALVLMVPMIAACDAITGPLDAITSKPPAPDEFAVLSRKPLQMPSSVSLPEPRLGEKSALEPDPANDAIVALLGQSAVSGTQPASRGETALLSAANAASEQVEIRRILEEETRAAEEDQPYAPPNILDLFGSDGERVDPGTLINPGAEARRLQADGVAAAPIDPSELPPAPQDGAETTN